MFSHILLHFRLHTPFRLVTRYINTAKYVTFPVFCYIVFFVLFLCNLFTRSHLSHVFNSKSDILFFLNPCYNQNI